MADDKKRGWRSLDDDERERILDLAPTIILSIAVVLYGEVTGGLTGS